MFRRLTLPLVAAAALLTGCTKEIDSLEPTAAPLLQDSWTWTQTSGGFTGQVLTPGGTGDQQQLEFGPDGQVRRYRNGRLVGTDTYSISRGTSAMNHQKAIVVKYGSGLDQSAVISGSQLTLRDEAADGQVHVYRR